MRTAAQFTIPQPHRSKCRHANRRWTSIRLRHFAVLWTCTKKFNIFLRLQRNNLHFLIFFTIFVNYLSKHQGMTAENHESQKRPNWFKRVFYFYRDGFRSMTVGKTLWLIILIKLFIFFVIIRWIFFPNFLSSKSDSDEGKAQYVREQLVNPNDTCR